jgi:hypothetical protein
MSEKMKFVPEEAELVENAPEDSKEAKESSAVEALNQLLEHAISGELEPSDTNKFDNLLNNTAYPALETLAKSLTMSEPERNAIKQSEYFQVYQRLFSDKKSLAALKEFALNTYEKEAVDDPNSKSFEKLRTFGDLAKNCGGDSEIADRFTLIEPKAEPKRAIEATEEDVEKYSARGIDINVGDRLHIQHVKTPFWVYKI